MPLGSHKSGFTAGHFNFVSATQRCTLRRSPNLSSRPASALLSRLADNVSDPILKRALKVHAVTLLVAAGHFADEIPLVCPYDSTAALMHSLLAQQEPVAFWGGFTAGALALNLSEDPLRSWIERTATNAQVHGHLLSLT